MNLLPVFIMSLALNLILIIVIWVILELLECI